MKAIITFYLLQLFAAGDVVHGTNSYVNANAPASSEAYVATSGSESGLAAEMKTFYDKQLISLTSAKLVHEQFGQKRPIPKNGGKTIEFRRFKSLAKALTPITEGVTPTGNKLTVVPLTATIDQYGDYIEQTDMLEMTSLDNTIVEATKKLADQAGRTMDTVVRDVIDAGTNVYYCPKKSGNTYIPVSYRQALDATALIRIEDIFKAAAILKSQNAPTINGSYVAIIHPYVAFDLMQAAGEAWLDIQKYTTPDNILRGEIGKIGNIRFVESTEAKIIKSDFEVAEGALEVDSYNSGTAVVTLKATSALTSDEADALAGKTVEIGGFPYKVTAATASSANSAATITLDDTLIGNDFTAPAQNDIVSAGDAGAGNAAVFCTLVLGADAYGVTDIAGGGIEHIVKQKGYGNDPLNQRSSIGWKGIKTAVRLVEEYMLRIESGSTFSATAVAN